VGLALGTLRAGATNGPDFPAMVDSLNGNTTDVTAAVGSLFGEPAASQFMSLWADHLDLLGTYAADVGADKQDRRQAVQDDLHNWQQRFAAFIDTATQSRVPAPDLAAALLGLDDLLLQQVDAFAGRDFPRAQQLANQTYPQVFGLARNMADAFGATLAARAPQGGAKTGAGGMAADLVPPAAAPPPAALPRRPPHPGPSARCGPTRRSRRRSACGSPQCGSTRCCNGSAGPRTRRSRCPVTSGSPAGSPTGRGPVRTGRR
jgi:hypothetical protein